MISITTSAGFYTARQQLGLSVSQCARFCRVDERTIRRWESEPGSAQHRDPAPSACVLMELALGGHINPKLWKELLS